MPPAPKVQGRDGKADPRTIKEITDEMHRTHNARRLAVLSHELKAASELRAAQIKETNRTDAIEKEKIAAEVIDLQKQIAALLQEKTELLTERDILHQRMIQGNCKHIWSEENNSYWYCPKCKYKEIRK